MKKIIFGFSLCGSFFWTLASVNGQASVDPGDGPKWVCCQVAEESYCTDMAGNRWNSYIRREGQSCG